MATRPWGDVVKILLSAYACEPGRGSEPGNGWNWAVHLTREGHEVHVLTSPMGRPKIEQARAEATQGSAVERLDFTFVGLPKWSRSPAIRSSQLQYLIWQRVALAKAREVHRRCSFDLVHHVTWGSLQGGSELWRLGVPFVFGPLGGGQVAPDGFAADFGRAWRSERLRSFLTNRVIPISPMARRAAGNASLVLATNHETMSLAERLGARRIEFFASPGLPEDYFPGTPLQLEHSGPIRLLWVGRLLPRKAVLLALDALHQARVPCRLTIVGDGPEMIRVGYRLRDSSIRERVERWGQVPWPRVREAYASHDALVFTSLRDSMADQLLEAMAFGLPIIALNHQGVRDLVPDDAGIKVRVGSREETVGGLARAVERLHAERSSLETMGRAGREAARSHTWPRRAQMMTKHYHEAVSRSE